VALDPSASGVPELAHQTAMLYAERAGFAATSPGAIDVAETAPDEVVTDAAASNVLAGARAVARALRDALREPLREALRDPMGEPLDG
jgi:hypothetical protein